MLEVFDRSRTKVAVLQNAFSISEEKRINAIDHLSFSLPDNDPKNAFCQPFHYARLDGGELYRIMPMEISVSETGSIAYQCEHVLALLLDDVLFGYHIIGNIGTYTRAVIDYALSFQLTKNWVLDECDFSRQFEYGWEQENILSALFSVPKPFTDLYIWRYNTKVYPFRLSLKRLVETGVPEMYIRARKNMLSLNKQSDPRQICTRLYPLGAGEGVNQLNIKSINSNLPYIQSPQSYINKYGIVSRIWIDRRYTVQQNLYDAAKAMLDELQEPFVSYDAEYAVMEGNAFYEAQIGKVVQIGDWKSYITGITVHYDDITTSKLTVANKPRDIASSVAELADRQRVEMAYSQGATQIYADSIADNGDANNPVELRFYIADTMKIVNSIKCKIRLSRFRSYSQATGGGGATSETTAGGGSTSATTSGGGGGYQTTEAGGGGTQTSGAGGGVYKSSGEEVLYSANMYADDLGGLNALNHNHGIVASSVSGYRLALTDWNAKTILGSVGWTPSGAHGHRAHSHIINIDSHRHDVQIPSHTHGINIPAHQHSVSISSHTHQFTLQDHTHTVTPGIFFYSGASAFYLIIDDVQRAYYAATDIEVDITDFLTQNASIARGVWHTIGARPAGLSRVEISYNVQGFVQSRGDKTL